MRGGRHPVGTIRLPGQVAQEDLLGKVRELNDDPRVHGILVQLPLPPHLDERAIILALDPDKDVDGLHPVNMGRLMQGEPVFVPCTPGGIQQLLLRSGNSPEGKHLVVCGRSDIVGKPIAMLMMQKREGANATVTVCHTGTRDLPEVTRTADILVAAMGRARAVTADMVREGAVVIDVGITAWRTPHGSGATTWRGTWTSRGCLRKPRPLRQSRAALAP